LKRIMYSFSERRNKKLWEDYDCDW